MLALNPNSLAETVDAVDNAFFFSKKLTRPQRSKVANWIAEQRGQPGSYAGMFAPTSFDYRNGIKVFTGEPVRSSASTSHVLGEEACRTLILLDVVEPAVEDALARATHGMLQRLGQAESAGKAFGTYCCGTCSVAYWRHLCAGGLDKNEERLLAGVKILKTYRKGDSGWRRFPFFYTLLAINEMAFKQAIDEMRYAAPLLEGYVKRPQANSKYSERRRALAERILARC